MVRLLTRWTINAIAILLITFLFPGIRVSSFAMLFVVALVWGLLNALVRPVLFWLTLPITVLSLGLFVLVLNGLILELTDWLVPGFSVDGLVTAILGALVLSVISFFTGWIGKDKDDD